MEQSGPKALRVSLPMLVSRLIAANAIAWRNVVTATIHA